MAFVYMVPGLANGLANLYNAWRDETPLLVLASQQVSSLRNGQASTGEGDLVGLASPFTRWGREVPFGSSLTGALQRGYSAAVGPPSGPAFLSVPQDVLESEAIPSVLRSPRPTSRLWPPTCHRWSKHC